VPIFIPHLGCPQQCVFCDQRAIAAQKAPTPDTVRAEIEAALTHATLPEIAFFGGSFTAIGEAEQKAFLATAAAFVEAGKARGIRLSTRPDCVDAAVLERLRHHPVTTVELGAQSMDDTVLHAAGRGHSAADTVRAARLIRAGGITLVLQMMTGLPASTPERDIGTARQLAALKPAAARIYPTCVIRGTPLEALWRQGSYTPQALEDAVETAAACLGIFTEAGIPVIRIGLNPTEELSGGAVAAGPYHPALGELTRARRLRHLAARQLDTLPQDSRVTLTVPAGKAPLLRGQKRCNLLWLAERYPGMTMAITEAAGQQSELEILHMEGTP